VLTAAAVIVFWRLNSVLGQRTGLERPPVIPPSNPHTPKIVDVIATPVEDQPVWLGHAEAGTELAIGLEQIAIKLKDFNVSDFVSGAKSAYELILTAFAKGDKAALKPLLTPAVQDVFGSVIDERKSKGETTQFRFVGLNSAKLLRAIVVGRRATIEVQFNSELINATLDSQGNVVTGSLEAIDSSEENWTFEKDISTTNPNWKLSATQDATQ
jgi:predicted lipid-binding transport protein (Tim44 family)